MTDLFCSRSNVLWNESKVARGSDNPENSLTTPKPDMFLGHPILKPNEDAKGLEKSAPVYNFSLSKLYPLLKAGLYSSPTTGLSKYGINRPRTRAASQEMSNDHLVCFPFAVIELKHQSVGGSREQQCFCQAANAASVALNMLENLYSLADQRQNSHHVPPIVAFTCIGPKIRLWIANSSGAHSSRTAHVSNLSTRRSVLELTPLKVYELRMGRGHDLFLGCARDAVHHEESPTLGHKSSSTQHCLADQSLAGSS